MIKAARELVQSCSSKDDLVRWQWDAVSIAIKLDRFCDEHYLAPGPLIDDVLAAADQIENLYYEARDRHLYDNRLDSCAYRAGEVKRIVERGVPKDRPSPGRRGALVDSSYIHRPVGGPKPPGRWGNER